MEDYFYFIITLHSNIAADVLIRLAYLKLACIILCISSSEST